MFFGDVTAVGSWEGDPRVEIHGPGYSKVLIGDDQLDEWEQHAGLIAGIDRRERRTFLRQCVRRMGERVARRARRRGDCARSWSRSSRGGRR